MFSWRQRGISWVVICLVMLGVFPGRAMAAGGSSGGSDELITAVVILAVLALCYVIAHHGARRLQESYLVVTGIEYLTLGWFLGPSWEDVPTFTEENMTGVLPLIGLAAGWFGLLRGTQARLKPMLEAPAKIYQLALMQHLVVGTLVGVGAWWLMSAGWLPGIDPNGEGAAQTIAIASMMLGCCAGAGSAPLELLRARYPIEGPLHGILEEASHFGDIIVLSVFGLIFCFFHTGGSIQGLSPTEWVVFTIGAGLFLGLFYSLFLGEGESENAKFLALVGIITFASGAAFFLEISPLLVNLVLGFVLMNWAKAGQGFHDTLQRTQGPMYLVLLIFAGALWTPPPLIPFLALCGAFVVARGLLQVVSSQLLGRITDLRKDTFRGLMAHGELVVAMAISFKLVYTSELGDLVYSVVLASVLLHDLFAPRMLRSLLVDSGELSGEHREAEAEEAPAVEAR